MSEPIDLAARRRATLAPLHPDTTREECRQSAIENAKEALRRLEANECSEVLIILRRDDDQWDNLASFTTSITAWVGRLEITKSDWIDALNEFKSE